MDSARSARRRTGASAGAAILGAVGLGAIIVGAVAAIALAGAGVTRAAGILVPSPAPTPSLPRTNPYWGAVTDLVYGPVAVGDQRQSVPTGSPTAAGGGWVMVRLFIPDRSAATGALGGDHRSFTPDPGASSRATVIWDTSTGTVTVLITHTTTNPDPAQGSPARLLPALPLVQDPTPARYASGAPQSANYFAVGPTQSPGPQLHLRLSLSSPELDPTRPTVTGDAGSVDEEMTILGTANGTYTVGGLAGDGHPAVEAYYYPRYCPAGSAYATILQRRPDPAGPADPPAVAPRAPNPPAAGAGAQDPAGWATCGYTPATGNQTTYVCTDTRTPNDQWATIWTTHP